MVKSQYKEDVPSWIVKRLKELAAIDRQSTAFRYGEYGTPMDDNGAPIDFEVYVSLPHLHAAMLALNTALVQAVDEVRMARER
jgi:hypothetical protein